MADRDGNDDDIVGRFITLACLTYGSDSLQHVEAATVMLDAHPSLAAGNIYSAAAAGDTASVKAALDQNRDLASLAGGPHSWAPLLYAAYSRIAPRSDRSTLSVARLLLDAGADPNAGYLWNGTYPFTALTGAFGGGEDAANQPRHPESLALARLLLEAGADPNDTQTLYNRMFWPDDEHLELLFEFGLGLPGKGPWHTARHPDAMTLDQNLAMVLQHAARQGFDRRVRLLLDHGVRPDADSGHPVYRGALAYELALTSGNSAIADMLLAAGARPVDLDAAALLVSACMMGDRDEASRLLSADPSLIGQAAALGSPLHRASSLDREGAVRLMLDLGLDVNGGDVTNARTTPLHEAVSANHLAIVRLLIEAGADPTICDLIYESTPVGWAQHFGYQEISEYLEPTESRRGC